MGTRADITEGFDNFNGSSQLTMLRKGGVLCRLRSTDVFRRALKASAVAGATTTSDRGADHACGHGPWSLTPRCLCSELTSIAPQDVQNSVNS